MFTTFAASPNLRNETRGQVNRSNPSTPPCPPQPKRSHVARACDRCRLNRIKCDNHVPCRNCQSTGRWCSNHNKAKTGSLSQATAEIERLRKQMTELEQKLNCQNDPPSPPPAAPTSFPVTDQAHSRPLDLRRGQMTPTEGAWSKTSNTCQRQLYGQSSTFFYVSRMCSFIGTALQQPFLDHQMNPNAACKVFASPNNPTPNNQANAAPNIEYLSRAQEDYFLGLFWQTYHCTVPILNEAEFRKHYETLWDTTSFDYSFRKPSPLVDIILALCMQYGMAFVPRPNVDHNSRAHIDINDSSIAGRNFYDRCQTLLMLEAETQSLTTLQCYIYSTIYLRNASFVNMAHNTLAVAIRVAHNLGLHREPAKDLPQAQRELRLRLWMMVYMLECKACESLGRPWQTVQISQMTCSLPADSQSAAQSSGSNFVPYAENITWLTYHVQCAKLHVAVRGVYDAFDVKAAEASNGRSGKDFFEDGESQEDLAEFLVHEMRGVQNWVQNVPKALMTARKGGGEPFSTDRSSLEIDLSVPVWLQRQRLLLELLYHNLAMMLYRPFIRFCTSSKTSAPLADGHAISCLNHAVATTNIINQVLQGNDILNGCHEAYQNQWTAALTLVGFSFGYPLCSAAPSARKAIDTAKNVLDVFGNNFATAASAVDVILELTTKVDLFMDRFRTAIAHPPQPRPTFRPNHQTFQPFRVHSQADDRENQNSVPNHGMQPTFAMAPDANHGTLSTMRLNVASDGYEASEAMWSEDSIFNPDMWPVY